MRKKLPISVLTAMEFWSSRSAAQADCNAWANQAILAIHWVWPGSVLHVPHKILFNNERLVWACK
jgi:hypothetical protein